MQEQFTAADMQLIREALRLRAQVAKEQGDFSRGYEALSLESRLQEPEEDEIEEADFTVEEPMQPYIRGFDGSIIPVGSPTRYMAANSILEGYIGGS